MPNPLEVQVREIVAGRVHDVMASTNTPGMVVGVVLPPPTKDQAPVQLEFHYGAAVVADGSAPETPVAADTHWEMGSETKLFTGLLLATMAPTGADGTCATGAQVCLTDPISDHLPASIVSKIGPEKAAITLLELATHTSGLPDDPPNLYAGCPLAPGSKKHETCADWRALYSDELMWDGVAQSEMQFSPGAEGRWLYSDLGFAILGAILADVADPGQSSNPFAEVVASELTDPLGLTATGPEDDSDPLLAMGYKYATSTTTTTTGDTPPTVVPTPRWNNTNAFIAGGGFTTDLSDVTSYVAAALGYNPSPLTPALAETLVPRTNGEGPTMQMGLAWQMMSQTWFPTTYGFKNGGTYGFKSATVVVPSMDYGVTMLSNSPGAPDPVVTAIMNDLEPLLS
jgi:D-alanyl-D-alanine-carboxypeptidase/D-alanyl-D-alanine-endopeptidase